MRRRLSASLAAGALCALLLAGCTGGVAADATARTTLQDSTGTWNGTYTPASESGTFRDAIPADDGGYLFVGQFGPADGDDESALAVRVDDAGGVEWVWSLQGYGNATLAGVVQLDDGRFLVAGTRWSPDRGNERFVAVLTDDGQVAWRDTYGRGVIRDAVRVPNGGALLVGGDRAGVVTPSGADVWIERYEDTNLSAAARTGDGYVLAGADTSSGTPDRLLVGIDSTGGGKWWSVRGGRGADRFSDVAATDDRLYAGGAAPLGDGSDVHPSVAAYHANGSDDWSRTHRGESPDESVAGIAVADRGSVAAVRGDGGGRLTRFATGLAGRCVRTDARPNAVVALGDGRYVVAGDSEGAAFGAVVAPAFESPAEGAGTDAAASGEESSGSGEGSSTDGESDGRGLPSVSVDGVPPLLTTLLVGAAVVATVVAVAVTALSLRRL